jgi:hypothetical protein
MDSALLRPIRSASAAVGLMIALLTACSTASAKPPVSTSVRKVDCSAAPNLEVLAERARQAGNRYYPSICALLADGDCTSPQQLDICFKKKLPHGHAGEARVTQVCLNLQYLEMFKDPGALDYFVVHEMAHVAQHYEHPIIGRLVMYDANRPFWWQEGIADYVCFRLGLTNGWECAECTCLFPHYQNGYNCAGAFLLYLERGYNTNLVRQLNTVLRHAQYTDQFFRRATGKELPALWAEFQQTRGFTPGAARMLELQQTLGFKDGRPPKNVERRLNLYLEQRADAGTRKLITYASVPGSLTGGLQTRLAIIAYFTQPGGSAEAYVTDLFDKEELPGFSKGQKGGLTGFLSPRNLNVVFPAERSFTANKAGDPSTYHYTVIRRSLESPWRLQRAWRTHADGQLADEYSLE